MVARQDRLAVWTRVEARSDLGAWVTPPIGPDGPMGRAGQGPIGISRVAAVTIDDVMDDAITGQLGQAHWYLSQQLPSSKAAHGQRCLMRWCRKWVGWP